MKVVHLVPAMEQGGVETVVCGLNRAAVAAGWESVVVSRGGRLVAQIEAAGGRACALDVKSKNPLTYLSRAGRLRRLLAAERPDLVCAHSRVPAWLFVWANRALGFRWITCAHGANSVSRYSSVMTRGDLTVVPSHFLAGFLKAHYGLVDEKIRVVHPGVDAWRFDPARLDAAAVAQRRRAWGVRPDDFVVMAVGRISPVKGYGALLDAAARLVPRVPNLKVVLVGDADARHRAHLAALRERAASLFSDPTRVVFAGGETMIPECLSIASVVVSANTEKPESFGLSMAEALMMDKPVVAKAFGGALDIVRDGVDGLLVRDGDFAAALEAVRGRTFQGLRTSAIARFEAEAQARRTLAVYRELVAG